MTIVTLTTDFGWSDGYVGIMKGVILGIAPGTELVDLSHDIVPQDVHEGAFVLARAASYFPDGTIHLAVVDPGVGSDRRPLLIQTNRAAYVGPDNGILTHSLSGEGAQAFELDNPAYWLPAISRTFHGRDIFAPVAAHLVRGVPAGAMGRLIDDPVRLAGPAPVRHPDGHIDGHLVHVDRFGNLISDIPAAWAGPGGGICRVAGQEIAGPSPSYAGVARGQLVALIGSGNTLEIAVRDGSAARRLGVERGADVAFWPAKQPQGGGAGSSS